MNLFILVIASYVPVSCDFTAAETGIIYTHSVLFAYIKIIIMLHNFILKRVVNRREDIENFLDL